MNADQHPQPHKRYRGDSLFSLSKVCAIWQWWNCYEQLTPTGKALLPINMDETSVRKYSSPKLGLVSLSPKLRRARQHGVHTHPANRQQQLAAFSHIAFLCGNTEAQAALPQVFIRNEHVLPVHVLNHVSPRLHKNVKLWRRKSSWADGAVLQEVLTLLSQALRPFSDRFQPVLLWDAAKSHLRKDVLKLAGKLGIWLIIIPARITWLLQPADTHCFARYKAYLRKKYLESSSCAADGHVSTEDIIMTMNAAIRQVFQKHKWQQSFVGNGFGLEQRQVRAKILEHLQWETVPQVGCALPNLGQFGYIWPRRADVPVDELFYAFMPHAAPSQRRPSHRPDSIPDEAVVPWIHRLRSRHRHMGESQDSAASFAQLAEPSATLSAASAGPWLTIPHPPAQQRRARVLRPQAIPRCRR